MQTHESNSNNLLPFPPHPLSLMEVECIPGLWTDVKWVCCHALLLRNNSLSSVWGQRLLNGVFFKSPQPSSHCQPETLGQFSAWLGLATTSGSSPLAGFGRCPKWHNECTFKHLSFQSGFAQSMKMFSVFKGWSDYTKWKKSLKACVNIYIRHTHP